MTGSKSYNWVTVISVGIALPALIIIPLIGRITPRHDIQAAVITIAGILALVVCFAHLVIGLNEYFSSRR